MGALDGERDRIEALLNETAAERSRRYAGDATERQPVHSAYEPADAIEPDLPSRWGQRALDALEAAGGVEHLIRVHDLVHDSREIERIAALVTAKLRREPIED